MNNDINDINQPAAPHNNGKALVGIILLAIGASLLIKQFDVFHDIPGWIFSFPMLLVIIGLYIGAKNNFSNVGWVIVTVVGFAFLLDDIFPHFDVSDFFWPASMIGLGIYMILRRKNHNYWDKNEWKKKWDHNKYNFGGSSPAPEPVVDYTIKNDAGDTQTPPNTGAPGYTGGPFTGDEHLDSVAVFGSVKKTIFSKNFQGGEIVNVMGGTELDFTQANINGRVQVEITQIFGGTKIIVPPHWMVVSDMAAVFAGVDDKRIRTNAPLDSGKVLVLKGVSIFAGVDIRSY